jgi:aryl-alcohol dehydrogenase-like predicted oxidoreductase
MANGIPRRSFGNTGVQVSALGFGGRQLGDASDEKTAIELVHRAIDGGHFFR